MTPNALISVPLQPGQILLHYQVLGLLAEGGMAEVYLARDRERPPTDQVVVLKRVRPHLLSDPRFETMFDNEARLASMIHHANVVDVHELARGEGELLLAMEFLNGKTLLAVGKTCDTGGFWVPHAVLARIVAGTAAGLHHAHILEDEQGHPLNLVHRDMSPENVIVCFDGRVKVVDFGVAKARLTPDTTQHGVVKGKLNYLAPESIRGEPLDARADIYALGVTLYLFLTAQFPYAVRSTDQLIEQMTRSAPRPPRSHNAQIPAALDAICMRCLEREREARFQSADELRQALERYIVDSGGPVTPRHVAAFMNQLYPRDSDALRVWVESLSGLHGIPDAPPPPALGHGATEEMDAPAAANSNLITGFTPPTHWSEISNIHDRATAIVTNLQASGVHVSLRDAVEAAPAAGHGTGERPLWQPGTSVQVRDGRSRPEPEAAHHPMLVTRIRNRRWPSALAFVVGLAVVIASGVMLLDRPELPAWLVDAVASDDAAAPVVALPARPDASRPLEAGVPTDATATDARRAEASRTDSRVDDVGPSRKKKKKKKRKRRPRRPRARPAAGATP